MTNIKDKIQRIKLARMGEEHRFVADVFSKLVPHKTKDEPNKIYFLIDDVAVLSYDKESNYLWCHYEIIWYPFMRIVEMNLKDEESSSNFNIMRHMREILRHFALGHFNISGATISLAHSFITGRWEGLKFKRVYSW